ncbi:hypothetical protein FB382_000539 [Nocardioides ginsengisegetis]|uniref:DUF1697 domain-containing protein n=1 Tax=Nocardioides ginsengisegetis TaxID=661491 RepID=A0A7W3IX56_9ACTN|nr:DUF1697 domain-containing protein [Nocardioides ginsengisegetis]MBA8802248.1 hypothetical protein [Nocardioides ginsengisegetis]
MATAVAFFRNLNLGQGWAPNRTQLEDAFAATGATGVRSVRSNGTVVLTHPAPARAAREVRTRLRELTGYDDVVVVRRAAWLRELVRHTLALGLPEDVPVEVAFFDAGRVLPVPLPWTSPDGRLRIVAGDGRHAVTTFHDDSGRGSNATVVLQDLTGVRVTSRGLDTVRRVVDLLPGSFT